MYFFHSGVIYVGALFQETPAFQHLFFITYSFIKVSQDSFVDFLLTLGFVCIIIPLHHKCFCTISCYNG